MIHIPGADLAMGSHHFYPEERPVQLRTVAGFWIDPHSATNAEFERFVSDTGYVAAAEHRPNPALLIPGSVLVTKADGPVDLRTMPGGASCPARADPLPIEHGEALLVQVAVGGQEAAGGEAPRASVEIGGGAAGLRDEQDGGGVVPGGVAGAQ